MPFISDTIRQQVRERSGYSCEYCKTQERLIAMPLVVDRIFPTSLGGENVPSNLAAACYRCNQFKSAKISGRDPLSEEVVALFHPRKQLWLNHFAWTDEGLYIEGQTAIGRTTVETLRMNNTYVTESRKIWISEDWHPPFY